MSVYNVSKHAVVALSECLFTELQMTDKRLHVSVLCPMFAKTRLADARRNRPAVPKIRPNRMGSSMR